MYDFVLGEVVEKVDHRCHEILSKRRGATVEAVQGFQSSLRDANSGDVNPWSEVHGWEHCIAPRSVQRPKCTRDSNFLRANVR
jgi:hypothetical protein